MKGWRDELGSRGVRGWRVRVMSEDYSLMHENKPWYYRRGGCVSRQLSYRSVFMSYRTDRVEIVNTFQYNDLANDYFEREPYSVLVRSKQEGGGK